MNGNGVNSNVTFLSGISQGVLPNGAACPAPVQLIAPTGSCTSTQEIRPTPTGSGIDPLALLNERCGTTSFPFTNTGTDSAPALWWVSGCAREIRPFVDCDTETPLSIDSPAFRSTGSPFTSTTGINDARTEAFDCISEGLGSIVSSVTLRASDVSIDLFGDAQLTAFTVNPWSNFDTCKEEIFQNNCSPCITTNGTNSVVEWNTGLISVSGSSGFFIPVPAGVSGRFQVCFAARGIQQMIPCGQIPVNCASGY